jgi:mRNA interferase MazF
MPRGDVVTVAVTGDYGKPRPAVIVQSDAFPETHGSVVVCQMTSDIQPAADIFRVTVTPTQDNGLRAVSQVMADKVIAVRGERIGERIGQLSDAEMTRLNAALAFVLGFAG